MDQYNNNENVNGGNENSGAQGFTPNYTPLSSFAKKTDGQEAQPENGFKEQQGPQAEPRPAYSQPVYEQPSYSRPEQQSAAYSAPEYSQEQRPEPRPAEQGFRPQYGSETEYAPTGSASQSNPNGAGSYGYNQNSGEYRYVPPVSRENVNGFTPPQGRPVGAPPYNGANANKKKKKSGRSFSTGAVILIVCACVLLSFGSGMLGSLLVSGSSNSGGSSDPLVVYKNNENKSDEDTSSVDDSSLVGVCARVSDSVVEITTEYNTSYGNYQYVKEGAGSGVIISDNGYIITNNHVVTDAQTGDVADGVKVRLTDGTEYDAKVVGHDSDTDVAILKIEAEGLSAAVVGDSDSLKVGQSVIAVGNPLGELGGTVTRGIVSATNREISVDNNRMTLIQIDAAINPGNSGGGLFNMDGELIGIVNAKSTGTDVEGLGFAIPVNEAVDIASELRSNGYVSGRTYIGISLADVTDNFTAYYYFRSENAGVYISQVQEGYNDGVLQYGDRITAIDGDEISSSQDVKDAVKSHKVGDKMKFTVSRQGKLIEVEVTCYEYVPGDVSFKK